MPVTLLHLHGFKCAGTTFIWSLERASAGALVYVESPSAGERLDWERVKDELPDSRRDSLALTSHLITLPPPGELARLKVAFLRDPVARLASAYRFQLTREQSIEKQTFASYVADYATSILANYQTRHLSPQEPVDWQERRGWAAHPESIDLHRTDLFVGLVERYDESIVALEHQLELLGAPMDLAYSKPLNTTAAPDDRNNVPAGVPHGILEAATELDRSLYRRVEQRLDERLQRIADLQERLGSLRQRRAALSADPPAVRIKPREEWLLLPEAKEPAGAVSGHAGNGTS